MDAQNLIYYAQSLLKQEQAIADLRYTLDRWLEAKDSADIDLVKSADKRLENAICRVVGLPEDK